MSEDRAQQWRACLHVVGSGFDLQNKKTKGERNPKEKRKEKGRVQETTKGGKRVQEAMKGRVQETSKGAGRVTEDENGVGMEGMERKCR